MYNLGWVIITDNRNIDAMVAMAKKGASRACAIVVGSQELAEAASVLGADAVIHYAIDGATPAEAAFEAIVQRAAADTPDLAISNDSPASRVLLGAAAHAMKATIAADAIAIEPTDAGAHIDRLVAGGIAVSELDINGPIALIYGGDGEECEKGDPVAIEQCSLTPSASIVGEILPTPGSIDVGAARVIVGIGRGVRAKDDLEQIEALAADLKGCVACTLPIHEDSNWYPAEQILGSSHNQATPDLYLALGISGSPNHLSGVKGAKVVVAVNNDPKAHIFERGNYGIVCDLYDFIPAFREALK